MIDVLDLCDFVTRQSYFLKKFGFQEPFELGLLLLAIAFVVKSSLVDIALTTAKLNLIKLSLGNCPERDVHLVLFFDFACDQNRLFLIFLVF